MVCNLEREKERLTRNRREAVLVIAAGEGYPGVAPAISLEGRCGVKNEDLIAMRRELEKEVGWERHAERFWFWFFFFFFSGKRAFGHGDGVRTGGEAEAVAG